MFHARYRSPSLRDAVAPKAEFPLEAGVQLASKKYQCVDQIRSYDSDAVRLRCEQPETMRELERQEQRRSPGAGRGHMHCAAFEYHLGPLRGDQWLSCRDGTDRSGTDECLGFE